MSIRYSGTPTKIDPPDDDEHIQAADSQLDEKAIFMIRTCRFDRGFLSIEQFVDIFLPAVRLNSLVEISLRIDKTNANERNSQITGFLAVVTGKNAKPAGVNRQGRMEAELGREIGDRLLGKVGEFARKPLFGPVRGAIQTFHRDVVLAQEIRDRALRQPAVRSRSCAEV